MKNILPILFGAALLPMAVQATSTSNVVGYLTITLPGTGGSVAKKLQIASQALLPGDSSQTSGTIDSVGTDVSGTITGAYLQDDDGGWLSGDYVGAYVVEITSGTLQGTMSFIIASDDAEAPSGGDGDGVRLYPNEDLSAADGETYRVLKTFTLDSLLSDGLGLGNAPAATVLGGGTSAAAADNFLILDPTTGNYDTYWYKNGGIGGTGWRDGSGVVSQDTPIHPGDGMLWERKQSADGELVIAGQVKETSTIVGIVGDDDPSPTTNVLNIVSIQHPVDQLTLSTCGLYTGDPNTGLKGGTSAAAADTVELLNATTGNYDLYWYKSGGIGGTGWRDGGGADATNVFITSGKGILITRKTGPSFTWDVAGVVVAP